MICNYLQTLNKVSQPRVASSSLVYRSKCKALKISKLQTKAVKINRLFILFSALRIGLLSQSENQQQYI